MSMESVKNNIYFFETIERISKFLIHLNDIDNQFYNSETGVLKDKTIFLKSYEECLDKVIILIIKLNKGSKDENFIISRLEQINLCLQDLQSNLLIHLPRPSEPIELRRFCRVINKQIVKLERKSRNNISIYINENTDDLTYASDPLGDFKKDDINALTDSLNKSLNIQIPLFDVTKKMNSVHITVPRIDASNPCHWPVIIHEVSHNLMKDQWFNKIGILEDFIRFLKVNDTKSGIKELMEEINIESWLIECWCDLFACALIGPAFYFAQYNAFLHSLTFNTNKEYPPSIFRLMLIRKFIEHRYIDIQNDSKFRLLFNECEDMLIYTNEKQNKHTFKNNSQLVNLFTLFNQYFIREFFILENGFLNFKDIELKNLFDNISPFVNHFEPSKIYSLVNALSNGLPIPSHRKSLKYNTLNEEPNSVQEIFLAGWVYRIEVFKNKILNIFNTFDFKNENQYIANFRTSIVNEFIRFDQSILRSIQISEWVDLLKNKKTNIKESIKQINKEFKLNEKNPITSLLVDREIYFSIGNNQLKIIPLIDINEQLGSTSLDIRLGTNFEVYFPNQFGILDFTDPSINQNIKYNSKKINLDFLKSIPINPGQFMLGHSLEYIKLPNYISADLEGRSSFARLGIEIHMTAGFIDPGFEGVLTFEIFNAGTHPIMLYPGLRIGQLRFMKIDQPVLDYAKRRSAKYRGKLEYHYSLQGEDVEIQQIIKEKKKSKINL